MTYIELILEPNPEGRLIFYAGNLLKGTVELHLGHKKKVRGLHVTIFGRAKAEWTETETYTTGSGDDRRTETRTIHFKGEEVYLNSRTYLLGQRNGSTFEMEAGIHRYNFECMLPDQLPYTMSASHGDIEYYAKTVLDVPWAFDKDKKIPFTVVRNDDLNLYPELRIPQKYEEIKHFCCFLCESGPLFMEVTVPYTGFAAGQDIPIKIDYWNKSNVDVESTVIKLKRRIDFTSHTPERKTKSEIEDMAVMTREGVKAGEDNVISVRFNIPSIMMNSNRNFCRVVTVSYVLKISGQVYGCHSNSDIVFPITIGTIGVTINQQPISTVLPQIQPSAPTIDQKMDDLPPSFEEAMSMPRVEKLPLNETTSNIGWTLTTPSAPES